MKYNTEKNSLQLKKLTAKRNAGFSKASAMRLGGAMALQQLGVTYLIVFSKLRKISMKVALHTSMSTFSLFFFHTDIAFRCVCDRLSGIPDEMVCE